MAITPIKGSRSLLAWETEVTLSAQQLTLELDDARTSTVAAWESLPDETRMLVMATLAGLVARMLEAERDD